MSHVDLWLSAWLDLSDEAAGRTAAAIADPAVLCGGDGGSALAVATAAF